MSELLAPFYLAIGTCVFEDGSGSGPIHVKGLRFPDPEEDDDGNMPFPVREIDVEVTGATGTEVGATVAFIKRECVKGRSIYFKPELTGRMNECEIRKRGHVVESDYNPLRRALQTKVLLTISLTTEPYWEHPWTADETASIAAVPGHIVVTDVEGDTDARVRAKVLWANGGYAGYVAVQPDPKPGYDYLDDYAGSTDANALSTSKATLSSAPSTATAVGTAPAIDTNANRGLHLPIVRVDSSATAAASTSVHISSKTTGAAYSGSTEVAQRDVALVSKDLCGLELKPLQIPVGQVPDVGSDSGWASEIAHISQDTRAGYRTLTSEYNPNTGTHQLGITQEFATFAGRATAFEYRVEAACAVNVAQLTVETHHGQPYLTSVVNDIPTTVGTHKVSLVSPIELRQYASAVLWLEHSSAFSIGLSYANGVYPGWSLVTTLGSGESAGDDLVFKVYGQAPMSFDSKTPVYAACSESGKTIGLDYVQRLPLGYAVIAYRPPSPGTLNLFYDGDTDTPYSADADGIGPSILEHCEVRRPLRYMPGVTNWLILGALQVDEVLAGATVVHSRRHRWLAPTP